jgi:hypothetical protein
MQLVQVKPPGLGRGEKQAAKGPKIKAFCENADNTSASTMLRYILSRQNPKLGR